jgi:hypothetical protein
VCLFVLLPAVASATSPCTAASEAGGVVINELLADPEGADAGLEWVEILNTRSAAVALGGWAVASGTSSYTTSDPFPGLTLAPGSYVVVGAGGAVPLGITLGNAGTNADAVRLVDCAGAPVDTVVYGAPNSDGWVDDTGEVAASLAPTPATGHTIGRVPDGADGQGGADFVDLATPTPGGPNDTTPESCGGPGSGVVVNELLPDPDGADAGAEWVELLHTGTEVVDLEGWALEAGTSAFEGVYTFGSDVLAPGERLLLGGDGVEAPDLSLGNAATSSDAVRLVDCAGAPVDTVVYGAPNTDGFPDDVLAPAWSLAPAPDGAQALQRVPDGVDTNDGTDFQLTAHPTPGGPNDPPAPAEEITSSSGCGGPDPPAPGCTTPAIAPGRARGSVGPCPALLAALTLLRRRPRRGGGGPSARPSRGGTRPNGRSAG